MAPRNEIPSFFKGILFRESEQRLRLPKAFGSCLRGRLPDEVFLRNPYRDLWPVEIAKSETGEYYFEEGWPRFFEQNKLEYKDFMIFQYDGNSIFDFKIYGNNMDEKEYTRFPEVKPEPDEVVEPHQQPRQPQHTQQSRPEVVQHEEMQPEPQLEQEVKQEPEPNEMEQPQPQPQQPQQFLPPHQPQQQHQLQQQQPRLQQPKQPRQQTQQLQPRQRQQQRRPEVVRHEEMGPKREPEPEVEPEVEREREHEPMEVDYQEEEDDDDDDFLFETEEEDISRNKKRKRAPAIREADEDVLFESGEIRRPDNPYFVTQRRVRPDSLYIPIDVVKAYDLKLPDKLDLYDEHNRKWSGKISEWKDGRTWLTGEWKRFCEFHNVNITDMCLCEFMRAAEEDEMFLKIRIVRDAALRRPVRRSW